ncbi:MAG TPA: alpha/beta hydrolase [Fibrella sp.]
MPLLLLAILLADLISIGFLFLGYHFWHEWQTNRDTVYDAYAQRCLYGVLAIGLYMLLGRFLLAPLLSKSRPGEDQPQRADSPEHDTIKRPDGSLIHMDFYGPKTAQPIIFVHGWNANRTNWYYQRKHFEKAYRLILMDLPGLGKSTRPDNKDFSLTKMAADLKAVMDHTGVTNPILWGHSIGGMTILTLLANHKELAPAAIKGVILEHTTYTNPVHTILFAKLLTAIQKPVLVPLCWLMILLSPLMWISRWMSYLNGNAHLMARFLTFTGTQTFQQLNFVTLLSALSPPAVTARGVLGMFKYDVSRDLSSMRVPALVIGANEDRLTRPVASEHISQTMPQAKLAMVAPGGHQGLVERHMEVNQAAQHFIQTLTRDAVTLRDAGSSR